MSKIKIFGINIDNLTLEETTKKIIKSIENQQFIVREDLNAAKVVWLMKDIKLLEAIKNAEIINADGQSIVFASRFFNKPLKERVTGIDLMENLIKKANNEKLKIFFLGATDDIIKKVVTKYASEYSPEIIAGYRNGYFSQNEETQIIQEIKSCKVDILFIGMGSPAKEFFINKYRNKLKIPFIMGVGGSFDVVAGKVSRAPLWMQHTGLEWFYRFLQEPRRMWKRYLYTNSMFLWLVLKEKFFREATR